MKRIVGAAPPAGLVITLLLLAGAAIGWQAIAMGLGQAAVVARDGASAAAVRPDNGWGLALLADRQFDEGQFPEARATSRAAIDRTPLAVVAVRTLAQAEDKLKGQGAGERAWQAASKLGWRDKPVQIWAARRALINRQPDIFAMRADALLRTGDPDELMTGFIRQAVVQPEIRRAFIARLAVGPPWRTRFFQAEVPPTGRALQGVAAVLNDLGASQAPPTRQELRDAVAGLIKAGRFAEATALDRRFVRRNPDVNSLLDDGGFDLEESDYQLRATPFDWAIDPRGAALEQAEGNRYIVIFAGGSPEAALRRYLALPPGGYRLEYASGGSPDSARSLQSRIICAAAGSQIGKISESLLTEQERTIRSFEFEVPAGCGPVLLTFQRVGGSGDMIVDDFRLQRS